MAMVGENVNVSAVIESPSNSRGMAKASTVSDNYKSQLNLRKTDG